MKMVASHVRATNAYAKSWQKPELKAAVPTTWAEVDAKYKSPRIMRQLRAIARAPEVKLDSYGYLRGKDAGRETVRTISANGHGAQVETTWRGGQSKGGQTWMRMPVIEHIEAPGETTGHFYLRGQRAAKASGKPAGERVVRNRYTAPPRGR